MPRRRKSSASREYDIGVFINCPFDRAYLRIFHSIVFAVIHCGFRARCAQEIDDGAQVRIEKIASIIGSCRYGIHDLSRTELDRLNRLPRFNMPLELGLFLGAKRFGETVQRGKSCLILDRQPHRYQKFISDIAGQDIRAHHRSEQHAIAAVRDWLSVSSRRPLPGGSLIFQRYVEFNRRLPLLCRELGLRRSEMTFNDYANIVTSWVAAA
jgi:hypothetical protein